VVASHFDYKRRFFVDDRGTEAFYQYEIKLPPLGK